MIARPRRARPGRRRARPPTGGGAGAWSAGDLSRARRGERPAGEGNRSQRADHHSAKKITEILIRDFPCKPVRRLQAEAGRVSISPSPEGNFVVGCKGAAPTVTPHHAMFIRYRKLSPMAGSWNASRPRSLVAAGA